MYLCLTVRLTICYHCLARCSRSPLVALSFAALLSTLCLSHFLLSLFLCVSLCVPLTGVSLCVSLCVSSEDKHTAPQLAAVGGVQALLGLAAGDNSEASRSAGSALTSITVHAHEHRDTVLHGVTELCAETELPEQVVMRGHIIHALAEHESNRLPLVQCGVIPGLVLMAASDVGTAQR